jgi:hypothetical protein
LILSRRNSLDHLTDGALSLSKDAPYPIEGAVTVAVTVAVAALVAAGFAAIIAIIYITHGATVIQQQEAEICS